MKTKYRRVPDWKILQDDGKDWYLENRGQRKSRIIIDSAIKTLIESIDSSSTAEIYQNNTGLIDEALQQENNPVKPDPVGICCDCYL